MTNNADLANGFANSFKKCQLLRLLSTSIHLHKEIDEAYIFIYGRRRLNDWLSKSHLFFKCVIKKSNLAAKKCYIFMKQAKLTQFVAYNLFIGPNSKSKDTCTLYTPPDMPNFEAANSSIHLLLICQLF